jgi:hypothetical protein
MLPYYTLTGTIHEAHSNRFFLKNNRTKGDIEDNIEIKFRRYTQQNTKKSVP